MSQGVSSVTTMFDKNTFEPHETCRANVTIDNSNCNLQVQHLRFALEQELELTTGTHTFRHTYTLADQTQPGVAARATTDEPRSMTLDLKTIRRIPPEMRKKKGKQIAWSPEDLFMLQNI